MLLVKTKLDKSTVSGWGLFADEDIPKGRPIWHFCPGLDQALPVDFVNTLPEAARKKIIHYCAHREGNIYFLCADDARFWNHSSNPNVEVIVVDEMGCEHPATEKDTTYTVWIIAARDIKSGEELFCDYSEYNEDHGNGFIEESTDNI